WGASLTRSPRTSILAIEGGLPQPDGRDRTRQILQRLRFAHLLRRQADVFQQMRVEAPQGGELPAARMRRTDAGEPGFLNSVQERSQGEHVGRLLRAASRR